MASLITWDPAVDVTGNDTDVKTNGTFVDAVTTYSSDVTLNTVTFQHYYNFEDRMTDLIDRYHPDLYYTDGGPPFKDKGYKIVSHLYNQSLQLHDGKLQAVANFKGGCLIGAENFEFEFPATLQKNCWQTDKTMGAEWYWLRNRHKDYKKGFEIVRTLIDVVSKNGNLLLNVPLTGDGELEEEVVTMLKVMAHDFDLIGEAIFSTRAWETFGEGHKNFSGISSGSARDIRFTRNKANNVLYVTTLGWPGDGAVLKIKTLGKSRIDLKTLQGVSLLGSADKLKFSQDDNTLEITLSAKPPYECNAYALKTIPLGDPSAVLQAKVSVDGAELSKGAADLLVDGKIECNRGPTFASGVDTGKYRFDLGANKSLAWINTYASGNTHARLSFTLYGSSAAADPGWNVADTQVFTPFITVDSRGVRTEYEATSVRRSADLPLGSFRWLVWAATPTMGEIGGHNTTFEEMQVIEAKGMQSEP